MCNAMKVAWESLGAVTSTIPKDSLPAYLKVVRDAVATARDKERRRRKVRDGERAKRKVR